ncbi:NAD(P)H-dependent oxidoreductase subunit E [Chromobacterium alticapitis]|uniref:NADP oxidoreductase n=1 Tax=Chromobacterium alticapitis TaxID=2073169 RepID=A0A2S5DAN3_9NEIS|nr:NAD(P)H-dependent oxidoreductase subunit E [Chromobacterium alticapitis]POZ60139.1 NADP oxidoreductase [Chromobacterium alticapitis]
MTNPPLPQQSLLQRHPRRPDRLLQLLIDIQQARGCVPADWQAAIADHLGVTLAQVRGVVDFYHFLSAQPLGDYCIRLSDSVIDRFGGSLAMRDCLLERLGIEPGVTRPDGRVSLHVTSCIGLADQGPAALVNGLPLTGLTPARASRLAALIERDVAMADWPRGWFEVANHIRQPGMLLSMRLRRGEALVKALRSGPEAALDAIRRAGLRGRGGAGFDTALKWRLAREAGGAARYVACNADEGEPGTFKDRVLLATRADQIFEGMSLAGYVIGAERGLLYLRGEYAYLLPHLRAVLQRRRADGLLGERVLGSGFSFDIDIELGAGAYVCGEETAMIESLEGKRGIPRLRPPFPVSAGYLDCPTANNNVETLACAALIIARGADAFRARGTGKSRGSKLLSVSGDVAVPGIYEFDFGATAREVLAACGAVDVQAIQVGGPSGVLIAPEQFDRRIAFEDLSTGGSFMVFDSRRDLVDIARQFTHFFAFESCGLCTPCRVGTQLLTRAADKLGEGRASDADLREIEDVGRLMREMSHCGLGQTAANPLLDLLSRFRPQWEARQRSLSDEAADGELAGAGERARP